MVTCAAFFRHNTSSDGEYVPEMLAYVVASERYIQGHQHNRVAYLIQINLD
jgi:hypothetical protein